MERSAKAELEELILNVRNYYEAAIEVGSVHVERCRPGSCTLGGWLVRLELIKQQLEAEPDEKVT